jgi:DNA-binding response OmpR family regulator
MRVVVLCQEPEVAEREPDGLVQVLRDLGCHVRVGRYDLDPLDGEDLLARPPTVIVVDAGDAVERAQRSLARLGETPGLVDVPALLAVPLARLPALDFSAGAADFVLTPIVPAELYARLRQLDWRTAAFSQAEVIKLGDLLIDVGGYEARLRGRRVVLTHQEFELLRFLAQHPGKVFTRDQLLDRVWGHDYDGGPRTVDIHVRRLRAKLGNPVAAMIETVRHVGYKLAGPE